MNEALLDDPERLVAADAAGLLRASAAAGAQVRATAEAVIEYGIGAWSGDRPRALVLVGRPGPGTTVMRLLAALLPRHCPVPVVVTELIPSWVGPLDVVVAHCDDAGDRELAECVELAGRRGGQVLLTAPADGPVAAAAAGKAMVLPSRVALPPGFEFPRALAAGLAVLNMLGLVQVDTAMLADQLDLEAERNRPHAESLVNPAKALALRLAEHTPLLWGMDSAAAAVADHAARMLAAHAAVVCDHVEYVDAVTRPALTRAAMIATSGADLFADPDEPTDDSRLPLRLFLLAVLGRQTGQFPEVGSFTGHGFDGADRIEAAEELAAAMGDAVPEAIGAAVLALRFEMAALYLGLATGTPGHSEMGYPEAGGSGVFVPVSQ